MSDDVHARRSALAAIALFTAIGVLILADLIVDYTEGASWPHLIAELLVLLVAAGGAVLLWRQLSQSRSALAEVRVKAEAWRREHQSLLLGLSSAIDQQFQHWALSKAEAEVGLLLLKGLSHKEIADVRRTSERTIREQARAIYRKSGLSGRASLSAFFLEDLLLPPAQRDGPAAA
jgi:DNA-binding CsgD family transcriptional regulator